MKVLSPEIINVARDQGFHFLEVSINVCDRGECIIDVPGSKSTAGKRTVYVGTWENHAASKKLPHEPKRRVGVWRYGSRTDSQ